ncbi:hypothetical protein Tco_1217016 [Tanacetum coccineum]
MRIKNSNLEEDRNKGYAIERSVSAVDDPLNMGQSHIYWGPSYLFGGRPSGSGLEVLSGASIGLSRKGLFGCGENVVLEEKGEEFCLDSKEDEVVPRVEDVPLVDGVLEGAFGGEGDDDFAMGEVSLKGWIKKLEWKPWIVVEVKRRKKMTEKNEEGGDYLI